MERRDYLNVGCGQKFHSAWTNVDMRSDSPHVQAHNLLNGFPYGDNQFAVVYHSQVLEHFPKENAPRFLAECLRVLRPGGVLRVVVPDLENIVMEYLRYLKENMENPTELSEANYDWILLELFDQTVRNRSGGLMTEYLQQNHIVNEQYVVDRIGYVGRSIIAHSRQQSQGSGSGGLQYKLKKATPGKLIKYGVRKVRQALSSDAARIGAFRLGGEIHMWMYDRFSLPRLLAQVGFTKIEVVDAHRSRIPDWQQYQLDVKDGQVYDPTSLFVEAGKPA